MEAVKLMFLLLIFAFAVIVPSLKAGIAEYDEVWQRREKYAKKVAQKAYHPNPDEVTNNFNMHVDKSLKGSNNTRRNLRANKSGNCLATNPIDRCWRCQPDWAKNRQRLADCVLGFGRHAIGGKNGKIYVVTDASDSDMVNPKPGTLRHAVIQTEPLWIIFSRDMVIRLSQELIVTSDKTIDGRGVNVHISNGAGLMLQFVKNVIIHGLHIHDIVVGSGGMIRDSVNHFGLRTQSDGDGISIYGSSNIWIDHISMSNSQDGLIDAVAGSTGITISNCQFTQQDHVLLFGASDINNADKVMQLTVAFNHFGRGLVQRMPRCRWGYFHVVNNDYTQWEMYAIGGSAQPTIISQGNRFVAPNNNAAKEVTKRDYAPESVWKTWAWRSHDDLMVNGAFFVESGNPITNVNKKDVIQAKPGSYVTRLTRFSGALNCKENQPC